MKIDAVVPAAFPHGARALLGESDRPAASRQALRGPATSRPTMPNWPSLLHAAAGEVCARRRQNRPRKNHPWRRRRHKNLLSRRRRRHKNLLNRRGPRHKNLLNQDRPRHKNLLNRHGPAAQEPAQPASARGTRTCSTSDPGRTRTCSTGRCPRRTNRLSRRTSATGPCSTAEGPAAGSGPGRPDRGGLDSGHRAGHDPLWQSPGDCPQRAEVRRRRREHGAD